jgi:hypothetical protein
MNRTRFTAVVLLLTALCAAAGAQDAAKLVAPYVTEETALVAHIDLQKMDPKAIDEKLKDWGAKLKLGPEELADIDAELRKTRVLDPAVRDPILKAGGRHLFMVYSMADAPRPGFIIATMEAGGAGNAEAVGGLLFSGKPEGPAALIAEGSGHWPEKAEPIDGNKAVFMGSAAQLARLREAKAAERRELGEALAAGGDAAIRVAFIPTADMRRVVETMFPKLPRPLEGVAATTLTRGVIWVGVGFDAAPKTSLTLTIKSQDAAHAQALHGLIQKGAAVLSVMPALAPQVPEAVKLIPRLAPKLEGDRMVLALSDEDFSKLVSDVGGPALGAARDHAALNVSMSNVRQLLLACLMYSQENRKAWPDTLEAIAPRFAQPKLLSNPRGTQQHGGYAYVKPVAPIKDPGTTIVIHEPLELPLEKVVAGFADGHVEIMLKEDIRKALGK